MTASLHSTQSTVRTSAPIALAQGTLGGVAVGVIVGALGYSIGYDSEGAVGVIAGAFFGGFAGLLFGLLGAFAVIVAGSLGPRQERSAAVRRDRVVAGIVLLAAGTAAGLAWMAIIDLEDGRRLREVLLLALAPAISALAWSSVVGLPHLQSDAD